MLLKDRTFFELAEPVSRRLTGLPDAVYLALIAFAAGVCIIVSQIIGGFAIVAIFGLEALTQTGAMSANLLTATLVFGFLPIFLLVRGFLKLFERRGLASVGMQLAGAAGNYARGFLFGLVMLGGAVLLMSLLGYTAIENPFSGASLAGAFLVLIGWIVQGAAEEVVTRGFLLQIFGRISTPLIGVLVSAFIFTAFHALNPGIGPLPVLNLFLFGIFAGLYTLREGCLWGIFAIHSVCNLAQGNLFGFEVSGNEIESAVVLDLMETGPDLLTGGQFGPEGGLIVTAILLLSMLWVTVRGRR